MKETGDMIGIEIMTVIEGIKNEICKVIIASLLYFTKVKLCFINH